jgi:hypothetical protein
VPPSQARFVSQCRMDDGNLIYHRQLNEEILHDIFQALLPEAMLTAVLVEDYLGLYDDHDHHVKEGLLPSFH